LIYSRHKKSGKLTFTDPLKDWRTQSLLEQESKHLTMRARTLVPLQVSP